MAAGDVTVVKPVTCGTPGGMSNLRLVTCAVEFGEGATGKLSLDAVQVGLVRIHGVAGLVWGATSGVGEFIYSTDAYSATGRATVNLECIDDASTLVNRTVTLFVWGE